MKKSTIILSFFFLVVINTHAQKIIENPEKPLSKTAGRVLDLKEVLRIRDGLGFFFSDPMGLKVDHNGCIYVRESRNLYQFSPEGVFQKNLYKKGEGPGEMNNNLGEILLRDKDIVLWSSNMNKLIRIDYQQQLIEDIRPKQTYYNLLGYFEGKYYLTKGRFPKRDGKSGIKQQGMRLFTENSQGQINDTSLDFPIQISINYGDRAISSMTISRIQSFQDNGKEVYLFHTPEYLIKVLDLEKIEVVRSFRRKYQRIEYEQKSERLPRYQNDVYWILLSRDKIWVVTSTFQQKKGLLVDVFSLEGQYLDNFYLPILGAKRNDFIYAPMTFADGHLFVIERGEDELFSVVKYSLPIR